MIVADLNDEGALDGLEPGFDVVLAGDVLEHLVAPEPVLRRAARLLRPGGRVVVSLPNVAHVDVRLSLLQGRWNYRPWGLLDRTHLRFFTREGIEALVEQAGLVITEVSRVRVPAFESELAVVRDSVPTAVVDHVLADPEAETYQFVFAAVREGEDEHLRRVAESKLSLERALEREQIARAAALAEVSQAREEAAAAVAEHERLRLEEARAHGDAMHRSNLERDAAVAERDAALAERNKAWAACDAANEHLAAAQLRVQRVEESVTWQTLERLRSAGGGESSKPVRAAQAGLRAFGRVALRRRPRS